MKNNFIRTLSLCVLSTSAVLPLTTIITSCSSNEVQIEEDEKAHDTNIDGQALFHLELKSDFNPANTLSVSVVNEQTPEHIRLEVEGLSRPKKDNKEIFTVINMCPNAGSSLIDGETCKFDLKFTCSNSSTNKIVWESVVSGLTTTYSTIEKTIDSDYDGLTDDIDPEPYNNIYEGYMDCYSKQPIAVPINYHEIITADATKYNLGLAKMASILFADAYGPSNNIIYNQIFSGPGALSKLMGCTDWEEIDLKKETYDTDKGDTAYCTISHRDMEYESKQYKIVFISFEGTAGNAEWISDFDVGIDDDIYYEKTGQHPDWRVDEDNNDLHTKGVCVAKNRIVDKLEDSDNGYFARHNINITDPNENVILFICGHSRGGAISNLLSAHYVDGKDSAYKGIKKLYGYCFASPYTTFDTNAKNSKYNCIHCIINDDDFIGKVPFERWRLYKYGQEHVCKISKTPSYKEEWENNWSELDDGNPHTYYHFDHFLDNVETLPVDERKDLYNLDKATINPKQAFVVNVVPYETELEASEALESINTSLNNLKMAQNYDFEIAKDTLLGGYDIYCINCGGALIDLVSNFFNGSEVDISDVINIIPTLSNYFDYALPLGINLLKAIIDSGNDNFIMDFGNCCHHCPTYYFAATHIDEE